MTIKRTALRVYASEKYAPEDQFPERPRRTDLQNARFRERPGHMTALARHYGSPDTTLIMGDIPVRHSFERGLAPRTLRYPDLLIAFNVHPAEVFARRGYAIDDQGKPPDFVLEIASIHTALNDYTTKRIDYAAYGIPEYWRFDNTGGDYYPAGLAGDRLVDGEYQPTTVVQTGEGRYWGHSDALDLDICWENGQLRWYDQVTQRYLLTHDEEAEGRIAERVARIAAEAQFEAERQARATAEERIRQLEQELRRRSR
jgi:Uma2 family endonuclease